MFFETRAKATEPVVVIALTQLTLTDAGSDPSTCRPTTCACSHVACLLYPTN